MLKWLVWIQPQPRSETFENGDQNLGIKKACQSRLVLKTDLI